MSLTIVYYNSYFCGNHETLHVPRSSIYNCYPKQVLGGGGVSSGHKYKIQLNAPPPSFSLIYDAKRGAYNRASTVHDQFES